MANDDKLYEMVCKDRFDKIDSHLEGISSLLRGKNGDPGLVEEVRGLKRVHKYVLGAIGFVACTGTVQVVRWISTKF